jgi:hypothetical protein
VVEVRVGLEQPHRVMQVEMVVQEQQIQYQVLQ